MAFTLAGVWMLGFALRRKKLPTFSRTLMVAITFVSLIGISACSAGPETLTPGVYTYTLSASEVGSQNPPITTSVKVTVPTGIDVQASPAPI